MNWKTVETDEADKPKMRGKIWCYTCDKEVFRKAHLRPAHIGHQVDYLDEVKRG